MERRNSTLVQIAIDKWTSTIQNCPILVRSEVRSPILLSASPIHATTRAELDSRMAGAAFDKVPRTGIPKKRILVDL